MSSHHRMDTLDEIEARELVAASNPDLARRMAEREAEARRADALSELAGATKALRELAAALEARTKEDKEWRDALSASYEARRVAEQAEHAAEVKAERESKRVDAITALRDIMRGPSGVVIAGLAACIGLSLIVLSLSVLVTRLDDVGVSLRGAGMEMTVGRVEAEKVNAAAVLGDGHAVNDADSEGWPWTAAPEPTE